MPSHGLNQTEKRQLAKASPVAIEAFFASFQGRRRSNWISSTSSVPDGIPRTWRVLRSLSAKDAIEIVAVRVPLHCMDGWSYLARASSALAAGDLHAARHLAYYAELRAALSILAANGIGIFNRRQIIVSANKRVSFVHSNRGTHEIAWLALQDWAMRPIAFEKIAGAISIGGVSLLDSMKAFFPSPSGAVLGTHLMVEWGFDLLAGAADRENRNLSSYEPAALSPMTTTAQADMATLESIWLAFEPRAMLVERHLLRKLLELESSQHDTSGLAARALEYQRLDQRVQSTVRFEFLSRQIEAADHSLLQAAADQSTPAPVASMLSRAALLLRVATGIAANILRIASVNPVADLEGLWKPIGEAKGFWSAGSEPGDLADLWLDVQDALGSAKASAISGRDSWLGASSSGLPRISEAERIGLWTICE